MKAVVQRVTRARVVVGGEEIAAIGRGMLILVCVVRGDTPREARDLADKIARFRFFPDEHGRMNRSALDESLPALVVSQFTLAADGRRGRRPSFDAAAAPEVATNETVATPVTALATVTVTVDPETGLLAKPECRLRSRMTYPSGSEPTAYCNLSHIPPPKESRVKSIAKSVKRALD